MKKVRLFLFAACVAAAFASCQKEEQFDGQQGQPEQPEVATVPFEFSANTENSSVTKLSLGKDWKPAWEEGDEVAIHDGAKVQQFVLSDLENSLFTGEISENATELHAIYPYEAVKSFANGKFTASIPDVQVIEAGDSIATDALLAMAQPVTLNGGAVHLAFKNVCGLVQFKVSASGQVKEFVLVGNKGEKFAGEGVVAFETRVENEVEALVPVFTPSENASTIVRVRPAGENATFEKGTYYAAVAPVTFSEGFSISLVTVNDAATVSKGTDKEMTVPRNSGKGLQDLVNIADWNWKIYTKEQLLAWNQAPTSANHKVELMSDIDMKDVAWTPKDFKGVFEGNNHKIYNLVMARDGHCGFFGYVDGASVKNLILGSKDGSTYDGVSKFTYTPAVKEQAGSWVHVGGVAAKIDGEALIENVINFIHLETPDSDGLAKMCMGGITSMGSKKETIKNCVNYGNITCNANVGATTGSSNHQIGGIISKTDGTTQIIGCKNYGIITAGGAYVDNIGGIIGNTNGNSLDYYDSEKTNPKEGAVLVQGCYNYGNIVVTKTTSQVAPLRLGGVVGKLSRAEVTDCHNEGALTTSTPVETGIAGVVGMLYDATIYNCTNNAKLTVAATAATKIYAGGIVGARRGTGDSYIENCVNGSKGMSNSLFDYQSTSGDFKFGGILGQCHESYGILSLKGCNNHSPIKLTENGAVFQVGGISGAIVDPVELKIEDCHNTADLELAFTEATGQRYFGGIIGYVRSTPAENAEPIIFTIKSCTNTGTLKSSAGGTANETDIAGIAGYALNYVVIEACTNKGDISTSGAATKPRIGGIAAVGTGTGVVLRDCHNEGNIVNASSHGNPYVGGFVGYANNILVEGNQTSYSCNKGTVTISNSGGTPNTGGITGYALGGTIVRYAKNQAKISSTTTQKPFLGGIIGEANNATVSFCQNDESGVIECSSTNNTYVLGGIAGHVNTEGVVVENSTNRAPIKASYASKNALAGGIIGIIESGKSTSKASRLYQFSNYGLVTGKPKGNVYANLGGMVGRITNANNVAIENCTNMGEVKVEGTSTNTTTSVGGIVGYSANQVVYKENVNRAKIGGTATTTLYSGGIWGFDTALASGYTAGDIMGNENYGEIYANNATNAYAGGLFGAVLKVAPANIKSDNANYGNVTSAGGALAGKSDIKTWSSKVGKNVKVNGVLWNAWAEGAEAAWLCPVATNALTATYVDAPAN